jgi:hypothetical protein
LEVGKLAAAVAPRPAADLHSFFRENEQASSSWAKKIF